MPETFDDSALFDPNYQSPDSFDDSAIFESDYQPPEAKVEDLPSSSFGDRAADAAIDLVSGVVDVGQMAVGAASLLSGGLASEGMRAIGYNPEKTHEILKNMYSDARKAEEFSVSGAKGFTGTMSEYLKNPAVLAGRVIQTAPGMLTIAGSARMWAAKVGASAEAAAIAGGMGKINAAKVASVAYAKAATKAAAVAEGAQQSGTSFDSYMGEGMNLGKAYVAALGSGVTTGATSFISGGLGKKIGLGDVEAGVSGKGGRFAQVGKSAVQEGVLEEMPQSAMEQAWDNFAHDQPLLQGIPEAAGTGLMVGGAAGGGMSLLQGRNTVTEAKNKGGVLDELELAVLTNIEELSAKDLGGAADYNQAIINGIMGDKPIDLPDHGMLHGSADEALKADLMGSLTMDRGNQAEIDAQEKAGAFNNRRGSEGGRYIGADQPLPMGQQIDVLYNEALKSKAPNINQFIIEGIYGESGKLVDHGEQQRPAPLTQAEVNQQAIEGVEQIAGAQPTPELEGELLGMVPAEEARPVSSEFQPVDPMDYDRPSVEQNLKRLYQESKQIEQETGGGNALQNLASDRGLDTDAFIREGLDPADIKAAAKKGMPFGKPLFKRGGMTPDEATEILTELGIDMSETSALDIIHNYVTSGEAPMIPDDEQVSFDLDARKRGNEKNIERYEDLLEEITAYDQLLETDGQQAADEFFYQNRRFDTDAQGVLGEFIEEVGVESETLEKLIGKAIKVNPERAEAEFDRLANKDASDAEIAEVMHKLIGEPERREEGAGRVERRKDIDHRKDIETMSQDEKDAEIQKLREDRLKNPKTKVAGRGAFDEDADLGWKLVGAIDGDGMGFFNSIIGHDPTDEIMQFIADEIVKFNTDTVRFYHLNGDEFASRSENGADHNKALKEVQEHFENTIFNIDAENASGDTLSFTISGFGMSYGTGETYAKADIQADLSKQERERTGKRAKKGYSPGGITAVSERTGLEADLGERGISAEKAGELVEKVSISPDEALGAFPGTEITAEERRAEGDIAPEQLETAEQPVAPAEKAKITIRKREGDGEDADYIVVSDDLEIKKAEIKLDKIARDSKDTAEFAARKQASGYAFGIIENNDVVRWAESVINEGNTQTFADFRRNGLKSEPAKSADEISVAASEAEGHTASQAQIDAGTNGNFKKGHLFNMQGFKISIENEAGTKRNKMTPETWPVLAHHYGDLTGTTGADGDPIDVFIKKDSDIAADHPVYVINQNNKDGSFDEHKIMMAFDSAADAEKGYRDSYSDDFTGFGNIVETTSEQLKSWINDGDTTAVYAEEFELAEQTEAEIQADEQAAAEAKKKETELEKKAEVDEGVDEFALTGSEREADIAAAAGQEDLLVEPAEEKPDDAKATEVLDAANVRGKDRLETMSKFRDGTYSLEDLRAAYPVEEVVEPETVAPVEDIEEAVIDKVALSELWKQYDDTGELTHIDLVDEVEVFVEDSESSESVTALSNAADKYRREQEEDQELGGRGDMDSAEDEFNAVLLAVIGPVDAVEEKPVEPEKKAPAEKIIDVGEKIGGARKDIWSGFREKATAQISDDEILRLPLSKIFPEPNYEKLAEQGADPMALALIKSMRDEIPAKGRTNYKKKQYLEKVNMVRQTSAEILDNPNYAKRFIDGLRENRNLRPLAERVDLMLELGFPASGLDPKGITLNKVLYSLYEGKKNVPKWLVDHTAKSRKSFGGMGGQIAATDTREEAIAELKSYLEREAAKPKGKRVTKFEVYKYRGKAGELRGWVIGKKLGRNYVDLNEGFKTSGEAREYVDLNYDELVTKLAKRKEIPAHRRPVNEARLGEDYRAEKDVGADEFMKTFGFRGVEFGNWVEQGKRQEDINNAYDGLMDLAKLLDIPPKAISLNGELAMAFGARGRGAAGGGVVAAAHYERDKIVINLTKKQGAGSLAHEWFHSLDNYFSRMRGGELSYATDQPYELTDKSIRPEMLARFKGIVDAINDSGLPKRAAELDGRRAKPYWATTVEMTARSFESYVINKLKESGVSNDYLANIVSPEYWTAAEALGLEAENSYPYILGEELEAINEAYDAFFDTIETKETEQGVALRDEGEAYALDPSDQGVIAEGGIRTIALTLPEVGYFASIFDNENTYAELVESAPSLQIDNGTLSIDAADLTGLSSFIDETITRREKGETIPRRFTTNSFMKKLESQQESSFSIMPAPIGKQIEIFTDDPMFPGKEAEFKSATEAVQTGTFEIHTDSVTIPDQAAEIMRPLAMEAAENFATLVLDKDKKPIAVLRQFYGTVDGASVYPREVITLAHMIPGAASVYFAHNHPSGITDPSRSDTQITQRLIDGFKGTGIEVEGHVILGMTHDVGATGTAFHGGEEYKVGMPREERDVIGEIPEYRGRRYTKFEAPGEAITSPDAAESFLSKEPVGVHFLDNRSRIIGYSPLNMDDVAGGRGGKKGWKAEFIRAIGQSNAASIILRVDDLSNETMSAVNKFKDAAGLLDVRVLDAMGVENDKPVSAAAKGLMEEPEQYLFRRDDSVAAKGMSVSAVQKVVDRITDKFPGTLSARWVVRENATAAFGQEFEGKPVKGGFDPKTNTIVLLADSFDNVEDVLKTIRHEAFTHFGLRQLMTPTEMDGLFEIVRNARGSDKNLARIYETVLRDYPNLVADPYAAAEEVVARIAEQDISTPLLQKIHAFITKLLRRMGLIKAEITVNEIKTLIDRSARNLRQELYNPRRGDGEMMYQRHDPDFEAARGKVGKVGRTATLRERYEDIKGTLGLRFRQGTIDRYASLLELNKHTWQLARGTHHVAGAVEAAFKYGKLSLDEDGAIDVDTSGKGLSGVLAPLGEEIDDFLFWMIGNRANNLMAEDREHLFNEEEIKAFMARNQGTMEDGRNRAEVYEQARKDMMDFQESILDIGIKTGTISKAESDTWNKDFYIPFYRILQDVDGGEKVRGTQSLDGLTGQTAIRRLKGGTENINDPLSNVLMNWHHVLSAAMKNQAAAAVVADALKAGIIQQVHKKLKSDKAFFVRVKGKKVWYDIKQDSKSKIPADLVLDSLTMMNQPSWNNTGMKLMRQFKRIFTISVTASPEFRIANLIRDTLHSTAVGRQNYNMWDNIHQGWKGTEEGSDVEKRMMAGGGTIHFGLQYGDDPEAAKLMIKNHIEAETILTDEKGIKKYNHALKGVWIKWRDFGNRIENVNRASLYQKRMTEGASHFEAAHEARDLLDFFQGGSWPAVRFLTQTVPFLNARLQGLDKAWRSGWDTEQQKQMAIVLGGYVAATLALYLLYRDDDDFKAREQWDRDSYHWFKVPGSDVALRIPKPFEVGAVGTVMERALEFAIDDEAHIDLFAERLGHVFWQTFEMDPVPQMVRPMLNIYANKDPFTSRAIESESMKDLSPSNRRRSYTSETAIGISKAMSVIPWDKAVLSPVQIEYLIQGYLGWAGSFSMGAIDNMVSRPIAEGEIPFWGDARPERGLTDWPITKRFLQELPIKRTKYTTMFYENMREINTIHADMRNYRKIGEMEKARELMIENRDQLGLRKIYASASKKLGQISNQQRRVRGNKNLTAKQKKAEIDRLRLLKNTITQRIIKMTLKREGG